jgi:OOP family OmpA-OmpF porin
MKRSLLVPLLLLLLLTPAIGRAQTGERFALNRYSPSERGSDWFVGESLDLRGHLRPALGLVADWSYKPLVLYDEDGNELLAVVEHQVFAHVGGALVLWDRVRGALSMPLLVYNEGSSGTTTTGTFSSEDATSLGDLRLGVDVRLLGTYGSPFTLAAGAHVHLPTGNQDAYAGDGNVRVGPRLLAAGEIGSFAYAALLTFNYRAHSGELDGAAFGNEVAFGASAGVRMLRKKLLVGPELFGSTVVSDTDAAFERRTTPVEVIFGGKYQPSDDWRIGAGVGPGLTRGFGAPLLRVLASIEWTAAIEEKPLPPAPSDRDGDGIVDDEDACPDVKGEPSADRSKHGCPPPSDRDGDGIVDDEDACPDVKGEPNEDRSKHGCPPPSDRDGDGILDDEDACPDEKGEPNEDRSKHGCPKARVTEEKIEILERVEFETASARLRPESDEILGAVLEILRKREDLTKLLVEGHTDDRGTDAYNQALSERRAAAVVNWLTSRGVEASRLESKGFGESQPIDTNETEAGRQNNRRVEFTILEVDGKPVKAREREQQRK